MAEEPAVPGDGDTTLPGDTEPGGDDDDDEGDITDPSQGNDSGDHRENKTDATLIWNGEDGVWKQGGGSEYWHSDKVEDTNFYNDDSVNFFLPDVEGEAPKKITVKVDGDVRPSGTIEVVVEGENSITFTTDGENAGRITGEKTKLSKTGDGTLTINTSNSYGGGTELDGGTIIVGNVNALGASSSRITITKGTLNMAEYKLTNAITINGEAYITGGQNYSGTLTVQKGSTLSGVEADDVLKLKSGTHNIRGGVINIGLTGTSTTTNLAVNTDDEEGATFNGDINIKGNITLSAGHLSITSATVTVKEVRVNGGLLDLSAGSFNGKLTANKGATVSLGEDTELTSEDMTFNAGSTLVLNSEDGLTISDGLTMTIKGSVIANEEIDGASADLTVAGGKLTISGATLGGDVTLTDGELIAAAGQEFNGLTLGGGTLDLTAGNITATELEITSETDITISAKNISDSRDAPTYIIFAEGQTTGDIGDISITISEGARFDYNVDEDGIYAWLDTYDLEWDDQVGPDAVWSTNTTTEWNKLGDDSQQSTFANLDHVYFEGTKGDIQIEGEVNPGSITINSDDNIDFVSATADGDDPATPGSIIGNGTLTKNGDGDLTISTQNDKYTGDIVINGGSVIIASAVAGTDDTPGSEGGSIGTSGTITVNGGGFFDGGTVLVKNEDDDTTEAVARSFGDRRFVFNGVSGFQNVDFTSTPFITFKEGAEVHGDRLELSKKLLVEGSGASFTGDAFVFNDGSTVIFDSTGTLTIGAPVSFETDTSLTTIQLSADVQYSHTYVLMDFDPEDGDINSVLKHFRVQFVDPEMADYYRLSYQDGKLVLTMLRPPTPAEIAMGLTINQRNAYWAMHRIAQLGTASGLLAPYAAYIANCKKPAIVREMMAKLCGAELASAMSSQIEGNMAHLRRLRAHIGNGQFINPQEGTLAAYVTAFHDEHRIDEDAKGLGHKRAVSGAVFGMETMLTKNIMAGLALSDARARIKPSNDATHNYENVSRVDLYLAAHLGGGWQSVTTFGLGFHSFDYKRILSDKMISEAKDIDAHSINFSQEISYAISTSENSSVRAYFSALSSFNKISAFEEEGADGLSLAADGRTAWATDLGVGLRFTRAFPLLHNLPDATFSVQGGLVASIGDTTADMNMHFVGAPEVNFTIFDAETRRWGYNVGAELLVPIAPAAAISGSVGAVMRGSSREVSATLGLWFSF